MASLQKLGGTDGLAKLLSTDAHGGLDPAAGGDESIDTHRKVFGANELPQTPPKAFLAIALDNMKDPIIIMLIAAATVSVTLVPIANCIFTTVHLQISTILGAAIPEERKHNGWIEGVAIWVAVLAVTLVGKLPATGCGACI
jgi:P-type Ca2+ transporter type 2C